MEINKKAPPHIGVSTAFLHQSPILFTVKLNFKSGHITPDEEFLIFENLFSTLLGLPFFQRRKNILDPPQPTTAFPGIHISVENSENGGKKKTKTIEC